MDDPAITETELFSALPGVVLVEVVLIFVADAGVADIATADAAVSYVRQVIDRHRGPVMVDLAALGLCDASGLAALLHMAGHAQQAGRPFRVASPSPSLVKIMQITGLDRTFLAPVRAENLLHCSDQQGCSSGRLAVMITDHVAAVRLPPDHADRRMAAAVPA